MATFDGVALSPASGDDTSRIDLTGTTYEALAFSIAGGEAPVILRGGSTAFNLASGLLTGHAALNGDTWLLRRIQTLLAQITGRVDLNGIAWIGRFIPVTAVYKNSDKITLAGIAVDLADQPLRSMQLQFIGETVQEHFAGSSTNQDGVYVAYLDTGDTYTAYAFSITRGFVYQLDHQESGPNTTTLVFNLLTKRGGFGEGLFLQGGA
jgi:hypothetical protein